ncbi:hypothetical protein M1N11_05420, partial [Peptococcaceae bacterium]|nr:hypothetical protein [Peptococcaceae bacterium]
RTTKAIAASIASVSRFSCSLNSFFKASPSLELCSKSGYQKKSSNFLLNCQALGQILKCNIRYTHKDMLEIRSWLDNHVSGFPVKKYELKKMALVARDNVKNRIYY